MALAAIAIAIAVGFGAYVGVSFKGVLVASGPQVSLTGAVVALTGVPVAVLGMLALLT